MGSGRDGSLPHRHPLMPLKSHQWNASRLSEPLPEPISSQSSLTNIAEQIRSERIWRPINW